MASVQDVYEKHFPSRGGSSSREVWSWFFMRISGLALVLLALGHLAIMHVLGGGVDRIDFDFVAARWHGLFWRSYDWLLLALALLHGANGTRVVIEDYVRPHGWRRGLKALLYSATFLFLGLGTLVIVTFSPARMSGR
ncbi:MAG: succinate dehydrogenase [Actinomycetota bacterium]